MSGATAYFFRFCHLLGQLENFNYVLQGISTIQRTVKNYTLLVNFSRFLNKRDVHDVTRYVKVRIE